MAITFIDGIAASTAGVATHLGYFNRSEHHLYGVKYIQIFLILFTAAITFFVRVGGESIGQAFTTAAEVASCYFGGLYTSLIVYRAIFHPLNKIPGPFGARISNFWFSTLLRNGDAYMQVFKLHRKYGEFVRIGSSDLSITHPKAVNVIYGPGSKCTKAAWYDLTYPMTSMQTVRQRAAHDQRRRIWSTVFGEKALRGYEDRMRVYRDKLVAQIDASRGQPVNITKWFNLYSFDVMGDLAFATSFNMLDANEEHWAIKLLNEGVTPLGWMFPMWFFRVMTAIPGLSSDWWKFIGYCSKKLEQRINVRLQKSL
jgi:tryprostatin B 6-hydroxylase